MNKQIQSDCQIKGVHYLADGHQDPVTVRKYVRLSVRKFLGPRRVRAIKKYADDFLNWSARLRGKPTKPRNPVVSAATVSLKSGDQVRIRSKEEIEMTLNHWGQLKGCSFAPEMQQYCGTTQRILKPVERFIDERDFRLLKTRGTYLLEGINCPGVASLGRCDRNCFFFWREEWLEKV